MIRHRGTIVVDSCTLLNLQASVSPQFFVDESPVGKPIRRYLDMLSLLGRNGYRILIPEIVALETGGVLLGAPNLNDLFSASTKNRNSSSSRHVAQSFLELASAGKLPGIEVQPADPLTEAGAYLASLRRIAADPHLPTRQKCHLLALAQKRDCRDAGEQACIDLITDLLQKHGAGGPVFFLTDDVAAQDQCHRQCGGAARLSCKGFLAAMSQNGLAQHLHLRPGQFQPMFEDLSRQHAAANGQQWDDRPLVDTTLPPRCGNDRPFQKSLAALAAVMGPAAGSATVGPGNPQEPSLPPATEVFRRKWNWGRSPSGGKTGP